MKCRCCFLVFIIFFVPFSCYSQSDSSARGWFDTTYFQLDSVRLWRVIDKPAYTIQIPTDWVYDSTNQEMGADVIAQTYQETPLDSFSENVTVMQFGIEDETVDTIDLVSYTQASFEPIKQSLKNFKEEVYSIEQNQQTAFHKWIYSGTNEKHHVRIEQYTFIRDRNVYIITLTTEAQKFYRYKDVGEKVLNSFSFKQ